MFSGNTKCVIHRRKGYSAAGEQTFFPPVISKCSVVALVSKAQHTTVRADSSATRGYAEEVTVEAKLLFSPTTRLAVDDRIDVDGFSIRVIGIFPRRTAMSGVLDHYEVLGAKWD